MPKPVEYPTKSWLDSRVIYEPKTGIFVDRFDWNPISVGHAAAIHIRGKLFSAKKIALIMSGLDVDFIQVHSIDKDTKNVQLKNLAPVYSGDFSKESLNNFFNYDNKTDKLMYKFNGVEALLPLNTNGKKVFRTGHAESAVITPLSRVVRIMTTNNHELNNQEESQKTNRMKL